MANLRAAAWVAKGYLPYEGDTSDGRVPLPAGDAIPWGAITDGTWLAGAEYFSTRDARP